ncbi:MAG: hypothetical protein HGA22_01215 [Clostridiales bacterium]|nr:hypothetical protein [Clostridiales bacterium]
MIIISKSVRKGHPVRKAVLIAIALIVVAAVLYIAVSKYLADKPSLDYNYNTPNSSGEAVYPDTSFAVLSDIHYYSLSLGTTGTAFENALNSDRKLLKNTGDLLDVAIDDILKSGKKMLLVSGDLTKDGELVCHQEIAAKLEKLVSNGIKVFVVPGNHDVNNPLASSYSGDTATLVPNVSADQFAVIYKDFGYGAAISRDTESLSYVAEPVDGLWIIGLDTCRSEENVAGVEEIYSGNLTAGQEKWLEGVLKSANEKGKAVIVLSHHGMIEHWKGQSKQHPEYLVKDYKYIGKMLASYGVRLSFTGHYHAQDITHSNYGEFGDMFDVETGSLATAPCSIRYCTISNGSADIESKSLISGLNRGDEFNKQSFQFVVDTVAREAKSTLMEYKVSDVDSGKIADQVALAFAAHYSGDEDPAAKPVFNTGEMSLWGRFIYSQKAYVVDGLWKDIEPADNNVVLELK